MVDYKEITRKKDHRTFVFCNIEDLLKDYYNVSTFEETLQFQTKKGEWIIHCPFCKAEGHTKHKLYIKDEPDKGGLIGYCFVCTRTYVNIDDKVNVTYQPPSKYGFNFGPGKFQIAQLTDPLWDLDKYYNDFTDYDEEGLKYLTKRHGFMKELYSILGIKFWNENPVIPFYDLNGKVFYYQIRFAKTNGKIKYYLPKINQKPVYMIPREGEAKHRIMIVEGIFDAIAALIQCPDYTPVAVLGSSISDYQIDFIREYSGVIKEISIWMDETEISKRIAGKVKSVFDYMPIRIIKSYGPDPEEVMNYRMSHGQRLQWIKPIEEYKDKEMYFKPILRKDWYDKIMNSV
jgi:hypothetical protein